MGAASDVYGRKPLMILSAVSKSVHFLLRLSNNAQAALHFATSRPVHANIIPTSIEASSRTAIAVRMLFVRITTSLELYTVE